MQPLLQICNTIFLSKGLMFCTFCAVSQASDNSVNRFHEKWISDGYHKIVILANFLGMRVQVGKISLGRPVFFQNLEQFKEKAWPNLLRRNLFEILSQTAASRMQFSQLQAIQQAAASRSYNDNMLTNQGCIFCFQQGHSAM